MTLTMTMTKRDKMLLWLLSLFLILALSVYFIILPQLDRHADLTEELSDVQNTQMEMQMAIQTKDATVEAVETTQSEYDAETADFYPLLQSYEAERLLTQTVLSEGLTMQNFTIDSRASRTLMLPYYVSQLAAEQGLDSLDAQAEAIRAAQQAQENTDAEAASGEGETESASVNIVANTVYSMTVSLTAVGDRSAMTSLIDHIYANYPAIRILGYSMDTENARTSDGNVTNISSLQLQLELYMCDK